MDISKGLFIPNVEEKECLDCGICIESCPGQTVDFQSLCFEIFGRQPDDLYIGNYSKCYVGYSKDGQIRYNSSSGGVATQLLITALEKKIIDGALVTKMQKKNPLVPEVFIARTKREIISASGSKYCPVALNIGLKQLLKDNGRFAVIGLPCHIHGIRKAERVLPNLRERIVLRIGLLCSHMVTFNGTHCILKKMGIRKDSVTQLGYRGHGWPGFMSISTKQRSRYIPLIGFWNAYWHLFSPGFFTPVRCTLCPDQTAELADISVGDAWLPELKHNKVGESIIITRTAVGDEMLEIATSANAIRTIRVEQCKVKQSQLVNLNFKKKDLGTRFDFFRTIGRAVPVFYPKPTRIPPMSLLPSILRTLYTYFNIWISSHSLLANVLQYFPLPVVRLYYGIYKALSII